MQLQVQDSSNTGCCGCNSRSLFMLFQRPMQLRSCSARRAFLGSCTEGVPGYAVFCCRDISSRPIAEHARQCGPPAHLGCCSRPCADCAALRFSTGQRGAGGGCAARPHLPPAGQSTLLHTPVTIASLSAHACMAQYVSVHTGRVHRCTTHG